MISPSLWVSLWVQNPDFQGVWSGFHQTLDRTIVDGGKEVQAALPDAHDSLPLGWGSRDGTVCDGVHKICSARARYGIPCESESDWQGLKAT